MGGCTCQADIVLVYTVSARILNLAAVRFELIGQVSDALSFLPVPKSTP